MKKLLISFILAVLLSFAISIPAFAVGSADWSSAPTITSVYEFSKGQICVEWEGNSQLYQVYLDGKVVSTVNIKSAILDVKEGTHQITIMPINYQSKGVNTNLEFDIMGVAGNLDLGALGIDPKNLLRGTPSETFKLRYAVNPLIAAAPVITDATTDFNGNVVLSFTDKYDSDVYRIAIKSGKDTNYVEFDNTAKDAASLITKSNASVSVVLDQQFLKKQSCLIPELDQKYTFSVTLQKWPVNQVDNSKETSTVIESKEGKGFDYTPYAAWKNAPEITYASQTAEGEITLRWSHDDNGLGCEYEVISYDKVLGIKKGETALGKTSAKEYMIGDMMNGKHVFAVVPVYSRERGYSSEQVTVEVANNWVVAPSFTCESTGSNQVKLKWTSPAQIDSYHITVYAGSGSLLRFVNLDYKKYKEFDVPAKAGNMDYTFRYDQNTDLETGVKLKIEIYGVRTAANGSEQRSSTSVQTILLK
ncbi:MAG: hypothetical protein IJ594_05430 [Oscillospiraceae bacterium]|nr:hypothetical protein [Oscillospiraceae bacterium]